MKRRNTKKAFATITVISLVLGASLTYGLAGGRSASAKSAHGQPNIAAAMPVAASSSASLAAAQNSGVMMPQTPVYALNSNNVIFVLWPGATSFTRLVRVTQANGNLIGIDFRPADGKNTALYALTDTGTIYTINLTPNGLGNVTQVSNLSPRFPSGVQSLMDFNPVVNALRLIGSDRLNYAAVNSGGNLNVTAIQTALSYDPNDVNRGVSPHVSAGAYDGNDPGVAATLGRAVTRFYGFDYDLDTFLTIQPATPGGSSATGGGVLQTLGPLVTSTGQPINMSSTADIDIYSFFTQNFVNGPGFINKLVGISGRTFFTIDMTRVNPNVPAGSVTPIVVQGIMMPDDGNDFIDIAAAPSFYEAENATLGGGAIIDTTSTGFSGTGAVRLGNGGAGAFVEFQANHKGTRVFQIRYSNGTNAPLSCDVTVNGISIGQVSFLPTGSWSNYSTTTKVSDFGANVGFRNIRLTSTSATGANIDRVDFLEF
jgi:hypothetical protein